MKEICDKVSKAKSQAFLVKNQKSNRCHYGNNNAQYLFYCAVLLLSSHLHIGDDILDLQMDSLLSRLP